MKIVCFTIDSCRFAFNVAEVFEIRSFSRVTPVPFASEWIFGVINLRGSIVPVYDLRSRYGISGKPHAQSRILITEKEGVYRGFLVDSVDRILETSEKIRPVPDSGSPIQEIAEGLIRHLDTDIILLSLERIFISLGGN